MRQMMTALPSSSELYPPARSVELADLLAWVLTGERDNEKRPTLRRALTSAERTDLVARKDVLTRWMEAATVPKIENAVSAMLIGFGSKATSDEESMVIARQFAIVLRGLPRWAIERACMRFANGDVRPEEIGAKSMDRAFSPSTAQLRIVADTILRPYRKEQAQVVDALRGVPERKAMAPEERARSVERVNAIFGEVTAKLAASHLDIAEADARRENMAAAALRRAREDRLEEYRRAGVKPPAVKPGQPFASLPMLLRMGWTIEEVGGERVLVDPAKEKAEG